MTLCPRVTFVSDYTNHWSGLETHLSSLSAPPSTKSFLNKDDQDFWSKDQDRKLSLQQAYVLHKTISTLSPAPLASLGTGEPAGPFGEAVLIRKQ